MVSSELGIAQPQLDVMISIKFYLIQFMTQGDTFLFLFFISRTIVLFLQFIFYDFFDPFIDLPYTSKYGWTVKLSTAPATGHNTNLGGSDFIPVLNKLHYKSSYQV